MNIELLTKDDLRLLKEEILKEIEKLVPVRNEPITKWLKSQEVRKILKCSPGSLQNLRINGQLKPKKIGGVYYYQKSEVEALFE
jgi:hypothetical protein